MNNEMYQLKPTDTVKEMLKLEWDEHDNAKLGNNLVYILKKMYNPHYRGSTHYSVALMVEDREDEVVDAVGYGEIYETKEEAKLAAQKHFESFIFKPKGNSNENI